MLVALSFTGCLDIRLEDQYSDPDAINSVQRARELLASAYNSIPRYQVQLSVLSDDFVPTNLSSSYADLLNLYNWQERAIDDLSATVWMDYYMTVANVNALLPRLDNSQSKITTAFDKYADQKATSRDSSNPVLTDPQEDSSFHIVSIRR